MKAIFERFKTDEALEQCLHMWCTQLNEAMNTCVAKYAPKGKTYCSSLSLSNRICIAIGVQNLGFFEFWDRIFDLLDLASGDDFTNHLKKKDKNKKRKQEYESEL